MKMMNKHFLVLTIVLSMLGFSLAENFLYLELDEKHSQSGLPIGLMKLQNENFKVELAKTDSERAYGLMNRIMLPKRVGMLFVFETMEPRSFWMKNTKIPLAIIYISDSGKVVDIKRAQPCLQDPCPAYPSSSPAQYVLEVAENEVDRLGIKVGYQFSSPKNQP